MTANPGNEKTEALLLATEGTLRDIEQKLKDEKDTTTSHDEKIVVLEKKLRESQSNMLYSVVGAIVIATIIGALMSLYILHYCMKRNQRS